MKYLTILLFLTTILWQSCVVKGWNIQELMKKVLETVDNFEEYDIVFPLVIAPGKDTLVSRAKRHANISEFQREYATEREYSRGNLLIAEEGGNGEAPVDNERTDISEKNVNRNIGSGIRCKTDSTANQTSSNDNQNTSINLDSINVVQERRNEPKDKTKVTFFDDKIKESDNTGPGSYEGGVTIIALKDWILEVRNNPILLLQDGFEAEWVTSGQKQSIRNPESCKLRTGIVRGDIKSVVALTTCDSSQIDGSGTEDMTGLIQVNGDSYFVQPIVASGGVTRQHPHLMYRAKTSLELGDDQDFGDGWKLSKSDSRQVAIMGLASSDPCGVGAVISECPKRSKRESYWRHDVTELKFSNTTVREDIPSTEERLDVYHVDEPEDNLEHTRAIIEHIRKELEREEVGYFLDKDLETEDKRRPLEFSVNAPPRWLELALAVDHTVIRFHGRERVQQYILALMNIVSAIYKDPSLDSNLRLVIVRMIFFEEEQDGQVVDGNSKRSLENVNRWNEQLGGQHDVAVWLTRADIGGPSGYAPVSGACDPTRSCTLNRDEGLTSAFIIAHEVAHVLGLTHDGDQAAGNDCIQDALDGSVMAPMVSATFHRFSWSICSKKEFHTKAAQWPCLRNQPKTGNATHLKSTLQATFSMDEQCRMEFGDGYSLCRTLNLPDPCSHLWCGHVSAPLVCKTKKGPPLEGTECGVNHWCVGGYCVQVDGRRFGFDPVTHNPRDGGWSEWSGWTSCSRTCGFGVTFRSRTCDNPRPAYGGEDCLGKSEEFRICGQVPCPEPMRDFRAQQCARLPYIVPIGGLGHRINNTWLAHEADPSSMKCQLTCVSQETGEVFMSGENLLDGTPCSYDNYDKSICIQGHCHVLGCDGVLDSTVQEDSCGVCGGDNSKCHNITHTFHRKLRRSMTRVAVFPRLARNVWIDVNTDPQGDTKLVIRDRRSRQYSLASPNDLRLKTAGPVPIYGTVTVWTVPSIKEQDTIASVVVEGARFHYERRGNREKLSARGPLLAELVVSVSAEPAALEAGVTVAAQSIYTLHQALFGVGSRYAWQVGGWGPCSKSCGGGRRFKTVACRDTDTGRLVPRRHCSLVAKPPARMERCNLISCDFMWVSADWEQCTSTCGSRGMQEREVFCVHNHTDNNEPPWKHMVDPKRCRVGVKPETTRPCNRVPCPAHWISGNWSQCSASCGHGLETREFRCPAPRGEPFFECGPSPPDEQRPCVGIFSKHDPLCYKSKPCRRDASPYCSLTNLLGHYCVIPEFRKLCCKSCSLTMNMLPE
ncbi:A disintegrin and metalloproteinase with thrombospondin motifs 3 isoform X2 [Cryptotermes secundus]|uniref:A disintegrin and metalloproteinase with thrombospondin motifs 3 isoform X2 n=1 Tax=Cryptotermes secundus TaxID=105785 RepID=UPI000CD7C95C|nr:A disintegrin and metalloproteinase with thrombospondin motifs 3 isoform X2 [Cryptotermes secundus]